MASPENPVRFSNAVKERFRRGIGNRYFVSTITTAMAWPFTRVFVALGMGPNPVSLLSFAASLAGMAAIAFSSEPWMAPVGGALLMIGLLWDHCDGQVARVTGKGSDGGGLLDTVLDRWVEGGWIIALGLGVTWGGAGQAYPPWLTVVAVAAAIHASMYFRWALIQKDIYLLRQALKAAAQDADKNGFMKAQTQYIGEKPFAVTTFYIPFFFNRDVTLWILFIVTLTPYWIPGLFVFAALHAARGLEMNWYTFQGLRNPEDNVLARFLSPDYHK